MQYIGQTLHYYTLMSTTEKLLQGLDLSKLNKCVLWVISKQQKKLQKIALKFIMWVS